MKIVLFGANGQLGSQIYECLNCGKTVFSELPEVLKSAEIIAPTHDSLDVTNEEQVKKLIITEKPDIVINCSAYTNVDACETNEAPAESVNNFAVKYIAEACRQINSKFVHISTDYVFDGSAFSPHKETDSVNPQTIYGKTKLAGEKSAQAECSRLFIIRTSWLYGKSGNNFVKTILRLSDERDFIKVVNDQTGCPTNCAELAGFILKLMLSDDYGVYHCTGKGECTWFEFAEKIVELSGSKCEVLPCTSEEYPSVAKRPKYSVLDCKKIEAETGFNSQEWEKSIFCFLKRS